MLTAAVSGSFHHHMEAISSAVRELAEYSVRVLSPADPRVVAHHGEFLFVASDRVRSVRLVQDRHLDCIRSADFLWLICPDGYLGQSASMEIGYAAGAGIPIFATRAPLDLTLREYVTVVRSLAEALRILATRPHPKRPEGILVDPHASVEEVHNILETVERVLACESAPDDAAPRVFQELTKVQAKLRLPTPVQ